jgi:hypothetical protein
MSLLKTHTGAAHLWQEFKYARTHSHSEYKARAAPNEKMRAFCVCVLLPENFSSSPEAASFLEMRVSLLDKHFALRQKPNMRIKAAPLLQL